MNTNLPLWRNYLRLIHRTQRLYCSKKEIKENEPIKFSTTPAARRSVITPVQRFSTKPIPWYQPFVVIGSIATLLIYFCVLREENDIDLEFNKTLYDRIKGLEKEQLIQSYRYNKEHGKSVADIEKRIKEIETEELVQKEQS